MALDAVKVKKYYDRFGLKQDGQGFYEDPPIERLIEHAGFEKASRVFEFGCGTGKLGLRLLSDLLPSTATYSAVDLSETMISIAAERLSRFGARASLSLSPGGVEIALENRTIDRFLSVYVLDLLPEAAIDELLDEARRVLEPGGRLCLVSLTRGFTLGSKAVSGLWNGVYHLAPSLVGGCRPITLATRLDLTRWEILHSEKIAPFGVPSEILVARTNGRS